ncbi:hypothetical protein A2875_03840 [Candidatus Gottesmanbacteria bacterium RIFCSPHIGHO2_01_FULL_46_14]|uniref:Uncharacterized protein n=1 Tax=Candidatus Gottesmanbacteria bacterium RIFCSPHIGHO2_01_FULL_46_14 TaxID=1798380 RepID=A0A1F5ZS90_9BACT|nr:MAG: hypothetical protein A2875_03840 [Candidatus Gottesmanbacteria bacterium RIFCSPHIGHO2_01_FULL_46_14]
MLYFSLKNFSIKTLSTIFYTFYWRFFYRVAYIFFILRLGGGISGFSFLSSELLLELVNILNT